MVHSFEAPSADNKAKHYNLSESGGQHHIVKAGNEISLDIQTLMEKGDIQVATCIWKHEI